jgi:hypothetical protein
MKHEHIKLRYLSAALLILVFLTGPLITAVHATDQGVIHFTAHVTSGSPLSGVTVTAPNGADEGACPGAGQSYTAVFDIYLMNEEVGPNTVQLTAQSSTTGTDANTYTTIVTINQVTYSSELGSNLGSTFTDSSSPFYVGGQASDPNVPASGQTSPGQLDAAVNPHTHVQVQIVLGTDSYYAIHGDNINVVGKDNNFYFYFDTSCVSTAPTIDVAKYFGYTDPATGNFIPLLTDVDGKPMVTIGHTGGSSPKFQNFAPSEVFDLADVSNPSTTTFTTSVVILDTLPVDAPLGNPSGGPVTGNTKVCFYDSTVFPLSGFPYYPSGVWGTTTCTGGTDITSQVSYTGSDTSGGTFVQVTLSSTLLATLGGFGPGDHITLAMKTTFAKSGQAYSSTYFADGPNTAGTYYHLFTNHATATADSPTTTSSTTLSFRGYNT